MLIAGTPGAKCKIYAAGCFTAAYRKAMQRYNKISGNANFCTPEIKLSIKLNFCWSKIAQNYPKIQRIG